MNATDTLVPDMLLAAAAGYAGTKVMEQFNMKTYKLEPEDDRTQEENIRPGPPFRLARRTFLNGCSASNCPRTRRAAPVWPCTT